MNRARPRIGWLVVLAAWPLIAGQIAADRAAGGADGAEDGLPRELGRVEWLRDFDEGIRRSRAENKPLFLLFQEVPGCQTCVSFGESVLSNPRLIEAIETEFIPVAILNNRGGADRAVLERFGEPAWNNPVVRFVDAKGTDLIPRRDRIWLPAQITHRMIQALEAARKPIPASLSKLATDLGPPS